MTTFDKGVVVMILTEKLDLLMKERGLNRSSLAAGAGIPYNTIVGLYSKGCANVKLPTLQRLCEYFSVPLDVLGNDGVKLYDSDAGIYALLEKYRALSPESRTAVDALVARLLALEGARR